MGDQIPVPLPDALYSISVCIPCTNYQSEHQVPFKFKKLEGSDVGGESGACFFFSGLSSLENTWGGGVLCINIRWLQVVQWRQKESLQ